MVRLGGLKMPLLRSETQASKWKFTPINDIEEANFNKSLERFYKMGVNGLTRENIQNSLDAALDDRPVIVKIKLGKIKKESIPGMDHIEERIANLRGFNSYTRETIAHMQSKVNQDEVYYISFEDQNTRGLTGAAKGQHGSEQDTWGIYAYHKGVHYEDENEDREIARGGSHGVGKIASNAASDLHMMFFANCDGNGSQHLGGTIQLIEHHLDNQAYRSTGYFTDVEYNQDKFTYIPYENSFDEVFKKDTRGLKIVIPFLREEYTDETAVIKGICDSFFIAILEKELEVHINGHQINDRTIQSYIDDSNYYVQEVSDIKEDFTPLYFHTYRNEEPIPLTINNIINDYHFDLYFTYNEDIPTGRVAIIRTIGMKIEDFRVKNNVRKPFNAVLIGGLKEDNYLKSLENESHTKLEREHINDPDLKRYATRFINNISREIAKIIDEAIREHHPVDGQMDTSDILYVMQTQFKKELQKSMGTVKVSKGRSLVKSPGNKRLKEKRQSPKKKSKPSKKPKSSRPRNPTKWQKGASKANQDGKKIFQTRPESVQRIVLDNEEVIHFDLSASKDMEGIDKCDISLSVIDGMGDEYKNEINLQESYDEIEDLTTGELCTFRRNKINDVSVQDGIIRLQLKLKRKINKSLKYIYYVEV